ncbi:hypothetical protein N7466_001591 [Penicillium verhagenii]|uniref:uncharacterized protein n=1 Tax=Penicillium verhagenii TaxID=1562060 RepID=UPI0025458090|nr:uncharacterized protein N7466_001496 [Penicillium verhagenii]XP_057024274.1 uncharacterized protein N7466_001591 [Penicillium verhagenii]KAJ5938362.1 hypothetical protein N7466_001496 [Penicillium verhagenii]KAJ5938457.1 hypothetical protein N7466_001591 [Penicillium verhagenii]
MTSLETVISLEISDQHWKQFVDDDSVDASMSRPSILSLDALLSNGARRSGGVSSLAHAPSYLEDPTHSTVFVL